MPGLDKLPVRVGRNTATIGTQQHFRWLEGIVAITLILNVLDAVLTLVWVYSDLATEANPFLHELVHQRPVMFVVVKFSLVSLGSFLLWRFRKRPLAVVAIFGSFLLYYFILLYHLKALELRIIGRWFE